MKNLSIIVALDEAGGFGKDGKIPWNYPEDLKHFKEVTKDSICIMGKKTYQNMLEMRKNKKNIKNILPNRTSFVLTSSEDEIKGAEKFRSLREAVESLESDDHRQIFILGGYRLFIEALTWANTIYVTLIPGNYDCDVHFPINVLLKNYKIIDGTINKEIKHITYKRIR